MTCTRAVNVLSSLWAMLLLTSYGHVHRVFRPPGSADSRLLQERKKLVKLFFMLWSRRGPFRSSRLDSTIVVFALFHRQKH